MTEYESILERAEELVESFKFSSVSREFREKIKADDSLPRGEKNRMWTKHHELFETHAKWKAEFIDTSKSIRARLEHELYSIDVDPDGAPIFNSRFSRNERVGDKIYAAREKFKHIQAAIKHSPLTKDDREALFNMANDIWWNIKNSEENMHNVHKDRADALYNEAYSAVEYKPIGEAREIFKTNQMEVRNLSLSREDRETMKQLFDDLWEKLNYRKEEASRQWRERTEQRLNKLYEIKDHKEDQLERVKDNLRNNYDKLSGACSESFRETVEGWIDEGKDRKRTLEDKIDEIERQIAELEDKLGR